MIPWKLLDTAAVPDQGGQLTLHQRGDEFSIRADRLELMNSRAHGSEEALAELGCAPIASRPKARVLVGGLGMGFTLRAALDHLDADAEVVVAELVPAVVVWNRSYLAHLAKAPLDDARVRVHEGDVAEPMRSAPGSFDAIVLDVDNGPEGLTRRANDWLYGSAGLGRARAALRQGGVLAVWSARSSDEFTMRMKRAGFAVTEHHLRARLERGGSRHTLWIGTRAGPKR
jgi:spermidine synthase